MNSTPDVVVLGHHGCGARTLRVHHMPVPGETITGWDPKILKDGGKGSHQAIVICRLGGSAAFIGKIGSDEQSEISRDWLIEEGVNIKHLLRSRQSQPQGGLILIDDNGGNSIISVRGIRHTLSFEEVQASIKDLKNAKIFITGFEIPVETALKGAKLAKELGMLTILNPAPAPDEHIESEMNFIDILIPNEPEAKSLLGLDLQETYAPIVLAKALKEKHKVGSVIITMGGEGVYGFDGQNAWEVPPIKVNPVDTTGAGDAFIGSFAWSLLSNIDLIEAVRWGNYYAALSVTREGTIDAFPYYAEIIEFIGEKSPK